METRIRPFQKRDTRQVAGLIVRTFRKFNGREYFTRGTTPRYLDQYDPKKNPIARLYEGFSKTPIFYVAVEGKKVVGMIRGNRLAIGNLFVDGKRHRSGIGRRLVERFEKRAKRSKSKQVKVRSTIYAAPFYKAVGFRRTGGIRNFKGHKMQPMRKKL